MSFVMAYYPVTLVVILIAYAAIFPVNGQCTVQGCDNGDPLISIFAEIQQLRVDLFDQLRKQVQSNSEFNASIQEMKGQHGVVMASLQIADKVLNASFEEIKSQLGTLNNMSSKAVDRCPLEQDICREQFQSMHDVFNESFQEMKSQHDAIVTSLQAVDRRLEEHDISIKNQTQNSFEENDTTTRSQTQNSIEEHDISIRNQTRNSRTFANGSCNPASDVCDCSDIKANGQNGSGVYEVCVGHQLNRTCTFAFCDMESANRVSLVFQRRKDGSVNFNRSWGEYRDGFGNPDGEFWLGNEMLHLLTSKRNCKLRVDLEDWEGAKRYAEYATFSLSSSADNYRLTIGGYSGNAGDSMTYNNRKQFSTIDANNDQYRPRNCAGELGGAWWYEICSYACLNGIYYNRSNIIMHEGGIHWYYWKNSKYYSLKAAEMKLIPVA